MVQKVIFIKIESENFSFKNLGSKVFSEKIEFETFLGKNLGSNSSSTTKQAPATQASEKSSGVNAIVAIGSFNPATPMKTFFVFWSSFQLRADRNS